MMPSDTQLPRNPKSYFLNLSYTSGESPSKIEQIISKYFRGRGFEVKTGRMAQADEKLDKGILQVIKSCGFGIVVYNELRHNISYEWGIMDGLGIPVILFKNTDTHIDLDRDISDKKGTIFVGYGGESTEEVIIEELEKSDSLKAAIKNIERLVEDQISPEKTEGARLASKLIVESNIPLGEFVTGEKKEDIKELNGIIDAMNKVKHLTTVGHFFRANAYYYAGDFENAEKEYTEAIRTNLNLAEIHYNFGVLLEKLKRFYETEKEYREAIRINPNYMAAHFNLGNLLVDLKRFDEAEKEYRESIKINPDFVQAHYNLGNLLRDSKRFDEAEKEFKGAIKINPDHAEAHNNLGNLLTHLKRFDEVENEWREAIRINPDLVEAHNNLGILLLRTERPKEGRKELETARELFKKQGREADAKKADGLLKLIR